MTRLNSYPEKLTKTQYVNRLIKMLNNKSGLRPCGICPITMKDEVVSWVSNARQMCGMCNDFVGLELRIVLVNSGWISGNCPCVRLGPKKAINRAKEYLERWIQGTHHWQKKGTKK